MNNINKNYFIIGGICVVILLIIVIYALKPQNVATTQYNELLVTNETETEKKEEVTLGKIKIHIAGAVVSEGILELEEGARISDAINMAGGTTANANLKKINLAYKLQDGQKIYIPTQDEDEQDIIDNMGFVEEITSQSEGKININTATQTELELISGIGPSTAAKIINYRKENGKFNSIEDIQNVSGIGEAKFESIKEYIII